MTDLPRMTRLLIAVVAVLTIAGLAALAHHGPYWLLTSLDDERETRND